MTSKLFTAIGITSAMTLNLQAENQMQNQSESDAQANHPNILMIMIDDLVPALNSYGLEYAITPNIDQLAAQATVFKKAYCSVPVCGASRASMLTGLHPTPDRFVSYLSRADEDVPHIPSIPELFRINGYKTISLGKIFHNRNDHGEAAWSQPPQSDFISHSTMLNPDSENWIGGTRDRGPFFEMADVSDWDYLDGMVTQRALEEIDKLGNADDPFFLAVGFMRPHLPFYAPKKYWDMYNRDEIPLAPFRKIPVGAPDQLEESKEIRFYGQKDLEYNSDEYHRIARHGYLACVSYVDALVGHLLESLEKNALDENTIIILTGDHGYHLGEHNFWGKHNLLHQSLHVPLLVNCPGKTQKEINTPVSLVDLAPTLLDLANLEKPIYLHGQSLISALDSDTRQLEGIIYSRYYEGDAILNENWLYIEYDGANPLLIDRKKDPLEKRNALNDPQNSDAAKFMKARLQKFREEAAITAP